MAAVSGCCNPRGCDEFFNPRFARRMAQRYRKRGLDKPSRRMVDFLEQRTDLDGATVLEIGGGVGEIQLELLKRGAARTVNLELSNAYDQEAAALAREAGVEDRVERRIHDIAAAPDAIEPVDIVVLHRVVCCYPDYERLLGAAGDRAQAGAGLQPPAPQRHLARVRRQPEPALPRCCGASSAPSPIRRRRCWPCCASAGSSPSSPTTGSRGRSTVWGGAGAPPHNPAYGCVVDSVNVSVLLYVPVRSGSLAPIDCWKSIVTSSLDDRPGVGQHVRRRVAERCERAGGAAGARGLDLQRRRQRERAVDEPAARVGARVEHRQRAVAAPMEITCASGAVV